MLLRHLDLFAGIGGFSLGLEAAGLSRPVGFIERDPKAQAVLRDNWPGVPIHDDIRTFRGAECGPVDIVTGGFPCQPWSAAGRQRGAEDSRDLWPEMRRVVAACRPRWVIGENVPGIVQPAMGLRRVLADLGALGYQAVTLGIPAAGVHAPHRRERVWIVANRGRPAGQQDADRPFGDEGQNGREPNGHHGLAGDRKGAMGYPLGQGRQDTADAMPGPREGRAAQRICSDRWSDAEWLRCHDGKARRIKPGVRLLAHGVPGRLAAIRLLGNAVVPQIVCRLGLAIAAAEGMP